MSKSITIFDFFKDNISYNNFFYEIDTNFKKSTHDIYSAAKELSINKNFYKQAKILVILPNSINYIECLLACLVTESIFVPLPYFCSSSEINKIISYINPTSIITDRNDIKILKSKKFENDISYNYIYKNNTTFVEENDLTNIASIYYSSGTTGNPKGVMYSNDNILALIESINKNFNFTKKDKHLTLLPFGHTASINYNIFPSLMSGCELYISRGFENLRSNFFSKVSEYKITYTQIVPTILFILNKINQNTKNLSFEKLKFMGCGSSTLPLTSQCEFIDKFNIKVANLYGLSESGPSHIDDPQHSNWSPGSIGVPLDVNKCMLNNKNEILLKGKNIFLNYYNNSKLYDQVVNNGWFNTGDIGKYENNKFWYLDRSKDLIIKSGINIVPMEVEESIYKHNNVLECCVVGKKDFINGENIVAVLILNNTKLIKENQFCKKQLIDEIKDICKKYLSNYKIPTEFYIWNSLPKTKSNKILRRQVRDQINS